MIREIVCTQQAKEDLLRCAVYSQLCMLGHGHCGDYKPGVFSECERCLDRRIKWTIIEEEENNGEN